MKLAFYSMTSCEGCLTTLITRLGPHLESLWSMFDIDYFKLVREPFGGSKIPKVDIAFVEGAVVTNMDRERLLEIRKNSGFVVALGTCASSGNIAFTASRERKGTTKKLRDVEITDAEPISSVITVDCELSGCPVSADEFTDSLMRLTNSIESIQPDFSVCYQCRSKGNDCLLEKGKVCLGPLAMGGCGAPCPSVGSPCFSCRGPATEADLDAYMKTLDKKGLDRERALLMIKMFTGKKAKEVFV